MPKRITFPLDEATARSLRAGDTVLASGVVYTSRDAGHKRLVAALAAAETAAPPLASPDAHTDASPGTPDGASAGATAAPPPTSSAATEAAPPAQGSTAAQGAATAPGNTADRTGRVAPDDAETSAARSAPDGALPFDPRGAAIYYVGPTPARPGRAIGSAGPTTSGRMDVYTPALLRAGVRAMIGKGMRSPEVVAAMREHGAVYFGATGGAGALLSQCVVSAQPIAYADLGAEALTRLEVVDMPLVVAIDSLGNDLYQLGRENFLASIAAENGENAE